VFSTPKKGNNKENLKNNSVDKELLFVALKGKLGKKKSLKLTIGERVLLSQCSSAAPSVTL
jgi:hypothetical protein